MKIIVDHLALRSALLFVGVAAAKPGHTIPILAYALIVAKDGEEFIELATTNIELTARIRVEAIVRTGGSFTIDFTALSDIAKSVGAPLRIETADNGSVTIESDRARFNVPTLPAEDFPTLPDLSESEAVVFSPSELLPMINSASYAVHPTEMRFNLSGVVMAMSKKGLDVVATDGHRMALLTLPGHYPDATLMLSDQLTATASKLSPIPGATSLGLRWTDDHIELSVGGSALICRRADVNFPRYRETVASDLKSRIVVDRKRLADAIARVMPFASAPKVASKALRVDITSGLVKLSCASADRGSSTDEVPCDYAGDPITVGYDAGYLADAVGAVHTETITLHLTDADSQLQVRPVKSDLPFEALHITTTMRL